MEVKISSRISFHVLWLTVTMPHMYVCKRCVQMSEFERCCIVRLKEAGWSYRQITQYLNRSNAIIRWYWQEWINYSRTLHQEGNSRPREMSECEHRAIVRAALTAPDTLLSGASSVSVTSKTIHRRFIERVLRSRRPLYRLPLTSVQHQACLQWCRAHLHWNVTDWSRIVFSNEYRFELSPNDQWRRVWRRLGQRCVTNLTVFR